MWSMPAGGGAAPMLPDPDPGLPVGAGPSAGSPPAAPARLPLPGASPRAPSASLAIPCTRRKESDGDLRLTHATDPPSGRTAGSLHQVQELRLLVPRQVEPLRPVHAIDRSWPQEAADRFVVCIRCKAGDARPGPRRAAGVRQHRRAPPRVAHALEGAYVCESIGRKGEHARSRSTEIANPPAAPSAATPPSRYPGPRAIPLARPGERARPGSRDRSAGTGAPTSSPRLGG
jgi:hypothetical protein